MEDFLAKSLITGIGVAISTSLLGVFILWRKMAYFGDSVSHSSIFGLALAALFSFRAEIGILVFVIFFSLLINFFERFRLYSKDTIIAITTYVFLAIALILVAALPEKINLNNYLLGDIISSSKSEIIIIYLNSILVILMMIFAFKKLLLATISEDLALIRKISVSKLNLLFILTLSLTIVVAVKITGIFLVTAMLIIPAAIARNLAHSPFQMLLLSVVISIISVLIGIFVSISFNYPASPSIILVMILFFLFVSLRVFIKNIN